MVLNLQGSPDSGSQHIWQIIIIFQPSIIPKIYSTVIILLYITEKKE